MLEINISNAGAKFVYNLDTKHRIVVHIFKIGGILMGLQTSDSVTSLK